MKKLYIYNCMLSSTVLSSRQDVILQKDAKFKETSAIEQHYSIHNIPIYTFINTSPNFVKSDEKIIDTQKVIQKTYLVKVKMDTNKTENTKLIKK